MSFENMLDGAIRERHRMQAKIKDQDARIKELDSINADLYDALSEAIKDMICTRNSAWHAAQTDPRWEGVSDILSSRINDCQAALKKARGES